MLTCDNKHLSLWSTGGGRSLMPIKTFALPTGGNITHLSYNISEDVYMIVMNGSNGSLRVLDSSLAHVMLDSITYHNGHTRCGVFNQSKQEVTNFFLLFYKERLTI
jgi:hypothetical protein